MTASSGAPDYAQPIIASALTKGRVTWTQAKVLGTASQFISSVNIYDDNGNLIQVGSTNITGGVDITTNQYDFSGKILNSHLKHQYLNGSGQTYEVATRNTYDDLGRLIKIDKNFNNAGYKTISALEYDALGRQKAKSLGTDPNDAGNPLEKIVYDYNIRGWLIGANRNYLTTEGQATDGTHFGFELGYDKAGNSAGQNFSNSLFNGNIAGMLWKSDGDDIRRKYDFTYDPANRLFKADFVQQNADDHMWNNSQVNYSIKMGDGLDITTAYDDNGNILRMQQWGWKTTTSDKIDDLTYSYYNNGNKLASVTDNSTGGTSPSGTPGMYLGDFVDKNSGSNDYGYDLNGNLVTDLNKRINGSTGVDLNSGGAITYNYLSLPSQIVVNKDDGSPKGTISYIYDATGSKLEKITVEGPITTTTRYIDGFVYQTMINTADHSHDYSDLLQFVLHEEGRIRYRQAAGALPAAFVYDYFIKDHLGNTRMVLTDEQQVDVYPPATLEGSITTDGVPNAIYNEKNYYTINPANVVDKSLATGITDYVNKNGGSNATDAPVNNNPNSDVTANSQKLYMLAAANGVGASGLGITLKVMSGDRIDIFGKSYYFQNNASQDNYPVPVSDILAGLLGAPGGVTGGHGVGLTDLTGQSTIADAITTFTTDPDRNNDGTGTTPKAYINWILFDDNFRYVTGNFSRVGSANLVKDHYSDAALQNIPVTKNGYLYVYVENESPVNVFFDNLQVIHTHGALVEESHYYPGGLTMAGLSDRALKANYAENKYRFNSGCELQNKEFADGSGLELYDAQHRMYDPQLGRFGQADPLAGVMPYYSPYSFASNDPITHIDPFGLQDTVVTTRTTNLSPVTVTGHAHAHWFYYPESTQYDRDKWTFHQHLYQDRLAYGQSLNQKGDPAGYTASKPMYDRWAQADKEGRAMQAWAVGIIAVPALAGASTESIAVAVDFEVKKHIAAAVVDAGLQTVSNAIEHRNIFTNYNFMSGAAALVIGAPEGAPLQNVIGVNAFNATLGTSVNISYGSLFGHDHVLSFTPSSILIGTLFGTVGSGVSGAIGGGNLGDGLVAPINLTGTAIDEATKPE